MDLLESRKASSMKVPQQKAFHPAWSFFHLLDLSAVLCSITLARFVRLLFFGLLFCLSTHSTRLAYRFIGPICYDTWFQRAHLPEGELNGPWESAGPDRYHRRPFQTPWVNIIDGTQQHKTTHVETRKTVSRHSSLSVFLPSSHFISVTDDDTLFPGSFDASLRKANTKFRFATAFHCNVEQLFGVCTFHQQANVHLKHHQI